MARAERCGLGQKHKRGEVEKRGGRGRAAGREAGAEVCAVGIAAGLESRRGPGSDPWTRGALPQPRAPAPGAEAGRGRLGGRAGAPGGMRGGGCKGPGGQRPELREGKAGGSGRGGPARGPAAGAPEVLVAGRHLLQEAGDVEGGGAHGGCAAGPPAGGNMAARAPSPAARGLRSADRNSRPRPAPPAGAALAAAAAAAAGGGRREGPAEGLADPSRRPCRRRGPITGLHTPADGELTTSQGTAPAYDSPWYPGSLLARHSRGDQRVSGGSPHLGQFCSCEALAKSLDLSKPSFLICRHSRNRSCYCRSSHPAHMRPTPKPDRI